MRPGLLCALVATTALTTLSFRTDGGDDVPRAPSAHAIAAFEEAQSRFTAANFDEALAAAERGLEFEPDSRQLLDLASRAAAEANEHDAAIWYAETLLSLLGDSKADAELAKTLKARIDELDLVGKQAGEVVKKYDDLAGSVLALAKSCESRKLFVNSVDLFLACKGTRYETRAEAELDRLYAKDDVASALLTTGMDLPPRELTREKARHLAAIDAKHKTWDVAWSKETRNYDIKTDIGYAMLNNICTAMDEMNRFYRKVFDAKGQPKKCKLEAYRDRKEFDHYNPKTSKSVLAFFVPDETRIVAYDGSGEGRAISDFWSTLFHEASHQFTHEVSKGLVPGWLNEGTASYFEGARLLPNGSVEINLVPEDRLRDLGVELRIGKPSLEQVVSYHEPGSYDPEYYAFGWGLVYFCHNYEDDACERPYLAAYKAFLDSWRKNNEKSTAYDRFVDYFVTKPKRKGVASFADFEKVWTQWIQDLHAVYFGGPDQADVLVKRARRQSAAKKNDAAIESYRFALRKRPDDLAALSELAALQATSGARDSAILNFRRALQLARQSDPSESVANLQKTHGQLADDCLDRITKIDKAVGDGVRGCVTGFSGAAAAAADVYWKGGFPRRALALLDDAIELLRGDHELAALSEKIRTETGIDLSRWHRLEITADLDGFSGAGGFKVDGDALVGTLDLSGTTIELKKIVQFLTCDEPLGTHYTVEAVIEPSDSDFATGVVFGNSEKKGLQAVVLGPGGGVSTFMYDEEKGPDFTPPKGHAKDGAVRLGAEVRLSAGGTGGTVTYLLEGKEVGSEPIDPQGFRPKAGVFGFLSHGRIHDLRIRR